MILLKNKKNKKTMKRWFEVCFMGILYLPKKIIGNYLKAIDSLNLNWYYIKAVTNGEEIQVKHLIKKLK